MKFGSEGLLWNLLEEFNFDFLSSQNKTYFNWSSNIGSSKKCNTDVEHCILTFMYIWYIGSTWYTPDLHVVTIAT